MDRQTLEMALVGFAQQMRPLQTELDSLKAQRDRVVTLLRDTQSRHRMSAAGRRRIALAQKRRWAEYRKLHHATH